MLTILFTHMNIIQYKCAIRFFVLHNLFCRIAIRSFEIYNRSRDLQLVPSIYTTCSLRLHCMNKGNAFQFARKSCTNLIREIEFQSEKTTCVNRRNELLIQRNALQISFLNDLFLLFFYSKVMYYLLYIL